MAVANYEISTVRRYPMFRFNLIAIALLCAVAACSPAPESSPGASSDVAIRTASQDPARLEITADKITRDVVGRVIKVTEASDSRPTDWTFEASEYKQVEILEREVTPTAATLTVFMATRNNPGPKEEAVQVSGKVRLRYQRKGSEWVLTTIENLTFHYTIGIST
jgi:hypothetical protein